MNKLTVRAYLASSGVTGYQLKSLNLSVSSDARSLHIVKYGTPDTIQNKNGDFIEVYPLDILNAALDHNLPF